MTPQETSAPVSARLEVLRPGRAQLDPRQGVAAAVRAGLTADPKRLPCVLFYDAEGSRLFEAICALPEYYVTRAEAAVLARHAPEVAAAVPHGTRLVELGSGSAEKTRFLIEALLERTGRLTYVPVDVSASALGSSSRALLAAYPGLRVTAVEAEYEAGLRALPDAAGAPSLVLWLGSNVGNFPRADAAAFLGRVRDALGVRDHVLLGVDLRKDRATLEAAYDDAAGVTARFNRNVLVRLNREFGADFAPVAFRHRAVWDEDDGRVSMYLVSERAQEVHVAALGLTVHFEPGEALHTEDSYKYSPEEVDALAGAAGFTVRRRWYDPGRLFTDVLLSPV
jgi:L-histidine Nalpha-methyltransferase